MKSLLQSVFVAAAAATTLLERTLSRVKDLDSSIDFVRATTTSNIKRDVQHPLLTDNANIAPTSSGSATLEIDSSSFMGLIPFFWTNIALGTPNQAFRTILDLNYPGALVRSEYCTDYDCGEGFNYSSDASCTFHDEDERFLLHLPAQFIYGNVSKDHMQLVGLNISNVTFGAVDDFHGENFLYSVMAYYADGALGFAPPNASMPVYTDSKVPNLLHKVVAAGVLDRNVMTLDLPFRPGEKGSLTLGTAGEELQESNVISIPFSNGTGDGIRDKWQMRIESIGVTGANSTTIPLTSTYATFELGPGFSFPRNITRDILKALNAKDEGFIFPEVNCSRWDNMPDLHLSLSGQQITLERDDYAFKGYTPRGETCAISIGENWFDWEPVALGFEFLRKFFVVFDMDNAEFRLISRNPPTE